MEAVNQQIRRTGLARRLVADGFLQESDASSAQEAARRRRQSFVSYLVENQILGSRAVALASCHEFGVPLFDLKAMDLGAAPIKLVDEKLIQQHHALPLYKRGTRLFVAVSDPTNFAALDEIKFHTGITTDAILVEEDKLTDAINKIFDNMDASVSQLLDEDLENLDVDAGEDNKAADLK